MRKIRRRQVIHSPACFTRSPPLSHIASAPPEACNCLPVTLVTYICMGFAVFLKATTVVAHLALRAPGNPAEESVARRLAWISMD